MLACVLFRRGNYTADLRRYLDEYESRQWAGIGLYYLRLIVRGTSMKIMAEEK